MEFVAQFKQVRWGIARGDSLVNFHGVPPKAGEWPLLYPNAYMANEVAEGFGPEYRAVPCLEGIAVMTPDLDGVTAPRRGWWRTIVDWFRETLRGTTQ